jgi:hypothetical protein
MTLLAFVVSVTDQCELAMSLQLSDLWFCELDPPELFSDHIVLRSVDGRQVDMERDDSAFLI